MASWFNNGEATLEFGFWMDPEHPLQFPVNTARGRGCHSQKDDTAVLTVLQEDQAAETFIPRDQYASLLGSSMKDLNIRSLRQSHV